MSIRKSFGRALVRLANSISPGLSWSDMERYFTDGGGLSSAGVIVSPDTALKVSAVWGCVRLIAGALATSPVRVYQGDRFGTRRVEAENNAVAALLVRSPNKQMTAATFWRLMTQHKLLQGNAYAAIIRNRRGLPVELIPIQPGRVMVYQAWQYGLDVALKLGRKDLVYRVNWDDGTASLLQQDDMLHVPNQGWNGWVGMSTIAYAAEALGVSLAAQESSGRFFKNGMQFQGVITYPGRLGDEAAKKLREYWSNRHSGTANAHIPPILTEGGEIKALNMNARDAQLIESRSFSVVDICRFFGVPPVMIGESDKTTSWGSGVEQMGRWFATYALNDHFVAFEQEMDRKLFSGSGLFAEFDETELTRGDSTARANFYNTARGSLTQPGFMTINEIRASEGLQPIDGGGELQRPQESASPDTTGGNDEK